MTTLTALATLVAVVTAALVALILHAGQPMEPSWWLYGVPFGVWIIGPAIAPLLLARRLRDRRWFVGVMLAFVALSSLGSAYAYYSAFFVSRSSTAALVMIFVPLYQWIAFGCVAGLGLAVDAWLGRRHFRR